jgi:hypothetical protein
MEYKNLDDLIWEIISCYDEEYQKELGMDKLDDEDIGNIMFYILDNNEIKSIVQQEIEEYCNRKN